MIAAKSRKLNPLGPVTYILIRKFYISIVSFNLGTTIINSAIVNFSLWKISQKTGTMSTDKSSFT